MALFFQFKPLSSLSMFLWLHCYLNLVVQWLPSPTGRKNHKNKDISSLFTELGDCSSHSRSSMDRCSTPKTWPPVVHTGQARATSQEIPASPHKGQTLFQKGFSLGSNPYNSDNGGLPKECSAQVISILLFPRGFPDLKVEHAEGWEQYTQKLGLWFIHFNHLPFNWLFTNRRVRHPTLPPPLAGDRGRCGLY